MAIKCDRFNFFSLSSKSTWIFPNGTKRLSCPLVPIYKHRITFLKITVYFHRDISVLLLCCSLCVTCCTRFFIFSLPATNNYGKIFPILHTKFYFSSSVTVTHTRKRQMLKFFVFCTTLQVLLLFLLVIALFYVFTSNSQSQLISLARQKRKKHCHEVWMK